MAHFVIAETIDAPAERIWELLVDPARYVEWQVGTVAVKDADERIDRVGASFTTVSGLTRRSYRPRTESPSSAFEARTAIDNARTRGFLQVRWTITRAIPPTFVEMEGDMPGGGKGTILQTVEPLGESARYSVELRYAFPAGFIGAVADRVFATRMLRHNFAETVRRLKALAEAG